MIIILLYSLVYFYFDYLGVILERIALFENNLFCFFILISFLFYSINTALLG